MPDFTRTELLPKIPTYTLNHEDVLHVNLPMPGGEAIGNKYTFDIFAALAADLLVQNRRQLSYSNDDKNPT